ncbi:hypothetical protein L873DRAFT_1787664 [Choiromyces venosus 120613-1]|uniref:C2H2-type domain-containing protein n=1 Tax=Choiromyces venosus 120613-1 TaxID=1336337 RepID=A0A3N4K8J5_9PEZI|nr:hypothetical protein L873DRAFT_1787664 [Choiromyces venosus 120613-1]
MPLPIQQDSPWEHVLPPQHPHLATQARLEKGPFLSKVTSLELLPPGDLHGQLNSSESTSPMSTYSNESIHSQGYESGNSPPPSTKEWECPNHENSSWSMSSLALRGTDAGATSPSSAGNFTETSSNKEGFSETVRSNGSPPYSGTPEQDDPGIVEPEGKLISQVNSISHRPRPFSRKSKAGNQHTVTPSAAGPEGGFICKFEAGGSICGLSFKLPSDIRTHLIEKHMTFSPFQCETCKRVYTRKSLYTRHLRGVDQTGSQQKRGPARQCPNRAMDADDAFYIRKETYAALWAIQITQEQVDKAVSTIKRHNGMLPSRRRRTQNQNETETSEMPLLVLGSNPPFGSHVQVSPQRFTPHQTPPYNQPYASSLPRTQSTSDFFTQSVPSTYTTPTETGSTVPRSPLAVHSPYQPPASYQGPQEAPIIPQEDIREYMDTDARQPLYGPNPVYPREYMESLGQSDNIDPNMLQQVTPTPHRTQWEENGQNYPTWPAARASEHRQQVLYASHHQGFKEDNYHYQSGTRNDGSPPNVYDPTATPRHLSTPDQFQEQSPKTGT